VMGGYYGFSMALERVRAVTPVDQFEL